VPSVIELGAPQTFAKEGTSIVATIQPRSFGEFSGLERSDLFVLYLIRDAYPERPFFFSRTTGPYAEGMGFAPFTVTTGLTRKLVPTLPGTGSGVVAVQGEGMFDLPTTRALWETVFKGPSSIAKREVWADRPSVGIPYLYIRTGAVLAAVLQHAGDSTGATRVRAQTERIARATQLQDVLRVTAR
jgi:hypothetical protein